MKKGQSVNYHSKPRRKRKGVHAKSKKPVKRYRGQGR